MHLDVMSTGGDLRAIQRFANAVQAAGLDGMVFTESGRTAYLSAVAAGLAAPGLHLATGVAVAFPRSPMVTAKTAWELAELTEGRFRLGIGTQVRIHVERRYAAEFDPPGPRLREYVRALRAIFRAFQGTEKLDFSCEYWTLNFLPAAWSPGPIAHPDVPVDVAAVNPWMLRMAGEVADGVHIHPLHSTGYLDEMVAPALADGAVRANRSPDELTRIVPVLAVVGDTEADRAAIERQVKAQLGFYGSTSTYRFQFERVGLDGLQARLNEKLKAGDIAGLTALVTDEVLAHFAVTATWEELPGALLRKYEGRADRLVAYLAAPMWQRDPSTLERWGDVAAALRAQADPPR
jgi:probable F420-dependent oxidoreductase